MVISASPEEVVKAAQKRVTLHQIPPTAKRFSRFFYKTWYCYQIARKIDADIYQFHDLELVFYGILLAIQGKKVIYDVHEDVPQHVLTKAWIPNWLRIVVSYLTSITEYIAAKWFVSVVTATPYIQQRFAKFNSRAIDINNYPILEEFDLSNDWATKKTEICYVGGISEHRGIKEMLAALSLTQSNVLMNLAGPFETPKLEQDTKELEQWNKVNYFGVVDRYGVKEIIQRSVVGLVVLHAISNYIDARPVKMFEYMAAGIPVIASNFPLWKAIVEGSQCGICVDPTKPTEIAAAIDHLIANPNEAQVMGINGREAVRSRYNWVIEERKLLDLYNELSNDS